MIVVSPRGPRLGRIQGKMQFISPSYVRYYPLVVESADCTMLDVDGNEYIDLNSGIACINVGHNHREVVGPTKNQFDRFLDYSNKDFYCRDVIARKKR